MTSESPAEDEQMFNLGQYLSRLTLKPITRGPVAPPMPRCERASKLTPLTLAPNGHRKLRIMESIDDLGEEASTYFSNFKELDGDAIRNLKLDLQREIPPTGGPFCPYVVNSASNVVNVLNRFFLQNIETLLGAIDNNMHGWKFQSVYRPRKIPGGTQGLQPIVLSHDDSSGNCDAVKLILLVLGPWEFTPTDFQQFTSLQRFDDTPSAPGDVWTPGKWENGDRMWAHLYDLCLYFDCPYFAVTSHEQWSFGGFSQYYTNGFISPPASFDKQPVSIAALLTYWIHVAFGKDQTQPIPAVYSERNMLPETFQADRQLHAKGFLLDALSGREPDCDNENTSLGKHKRCDTDTDDCAPDVGSICTDPHSTHGSLWQDMITIKRLTAKPNTRAASQLLLALPQPPWLPSPTLLLRHLRRLTRIPWRNRKVAKQEIVGRSIRWRPKRAFRQSIKARDALKKKQDLSPEPVVYIDPSVASSSKDLLTEQQIRTLDSAAIQRWRDLVALIEEHGEEPPAAALKEQGKWVDSLTYDPITGELTGDIGRLEDHTCSSCGPPSATLSDCSLSSEELARYNQQEEPDFDGVDLHQWF